MPTLPRVGWTNPPSSGNERPMPTTQAASKSAAPPLLNAVMMGAALAYGVWMLVQRGRLSWPPHDVLADAYTLAGCLALVGPLVLARREAEGGVGDLLWMTGGLLVWVFDMAALVQGNGWARSWITPLGARTMGLTMLAVLLAGWRSRGAGREWSWTNVTGWILGLFWVGMAVLSLAPGRAARWTVQGAP
jgi:hypothetical protein